ncbi:MAG: hypothetical protein C4324_12040 [Blastocatellia bacterium]
MRIESFRTNEARLANIAKNVRAVFLNLGTHLAVTLNVWKVREYSQAEGQLIEPVTFLCPESRETITSLGKRPRPLGGNLRAWARRLGLDLFPNLLKVLKGSLKIVVGNASFLWVKA